MNDLTFELRGFTNGATRPLMGMKFDAGRLPAEECGLCGHLMVLGKIEMGRDGMAFAGWAEWWFCTDCGTYELVQVPPR